MGSYLQNYDLVLSDCKIVDDTGAIIQNSYFKYKNSNKGLFANLVRNSYMGCCMAFNRKVLQAALPFPPNLHMHDWWLGIIAEAFGSVYFCDLPLILHVRHENNMSTTASKSPNSFTKKISIRYNILINLFKRMINYK
jgi:hypothetical protein